MKTPTLVKPKLDNIPMLGTYVSVKCKSCNKNVGNWVKGRFGYADCECTLMSGKGKFRTLIELDL